MPSPLQLRVLLDGFSPYGLAGLAARYDAAAAGGVVYDGSNRVSQWSDRTGNGLHLVQATGAAQPLLSGKAIQFNGSHFLKTAAFTLNQPATVILVGRQTVWNGNYICDGDAINSGVVYQDPSTPSVRLYAGSAAAANGNFAVGTDSVLIATFNGASSALQVNFTAETTGNPGAANPGGFTLGAGGDGSAKTQIQINEVLVAAVAFDAATKAKIVRFLARKWGVTT